MIYLAIAVLLLLAVVSYLLSRSPVFPSVVFCGTWAFILSLTALAGDLFNPLSVKTLVIYCAGATAFSFGSAATMLLPSRHPNGFAPVPNRTINWLLLICLLGGVYVYYWSVGLSSGIEGVSQLTAVRMMMVEQGTDTDLASSVAQNIIGLAGIVAMICFYEAGKKRKIFALILAATLGLLTGSRASTFILILALPALDWLKHRRIRWKLVSVLVIALLVVFSTIAIFLSNGNVNANSSLSENVAPLRDVFLLYAAGGVVAFDNVVRDPNVIPHVWQISTPLLLILNKFGAHFEIPTQHAAFLAVGPHNLVTNVYTMYFAFFDWGILGMLFLTFAAGSVATMFYRTAISGSRIATVVYAYFFAACVLSVFAEYFAGFNFLAKLMIVSWCVYSLPQRFRIFLLGLN
jgi:oligosaccharide repeat unit polymerase